MADFAIMRNLKQAHYITFADKFEVSQRVTRSVNCRHSPDILNRLSFKIVSSERIRLPTFSNNY